MVFGYFYTIEEVEDGEATVWGDFDFQHFKQSILDALWSVGTGVWYVDYDDCASGGAAAD